MPESRTRRDASAPCRSSSSAMLAAGLGVLRGVVQEIGDHLRRVARSPRAPTAARACRVDLKLVAE